MTREEAINEIKSWDFLEGKEIEAIHTLIPELKESEDERIRKRLLWFLANYTGKWDYPETRMACRAWLEKQKEQKPETRDADDLQLLGFIYDLLNEIEWKDDWAMSKDECLRRLNNYRPQPKQEWSEEDEEMLNNIEYILHKDISYTPPTKPNSCTGSGNAYYTHQTEIDWLKSLRPSWKPSKEQMEALQNAVALTACDKELVRLYNQLKKL